MPSRGGVTECRPDGRRATRIAEQMGRDEAPRWSFFVEAVRAGPDPPRAVACLRPAWLTTRASCGWLKMVSTTACLKMV